jgi:Glycosyl transferases group 1
VLDRDGSIKERTERFLAEHPGASFDDVERACFAGEDGRLALFAVSPRHLEACATRTCQVLVRGGYNRVLEPGRHYIELESNLSNLDAVLATLDDEARRVRIVDAAYADVVASGRYTYRAMVEDIEHVALAGAATAQASAHDRGALALNRAAERIAWWRIVYILRVRPRVMAWRGRLGVPTLRGAVNRLRWSRPAAALAACIPGPIKLRLKRLARGGHE